MSDITRYCDRRVCREKGGKSQMVWKKTVWKKECRVNLIKLKKVCRVSLATPTHFSVLMDGGPLRAVGDAPVRVRHDGLPRAVGDADASSDEDLEVSTSEEEAEEAVSFFAVRTSVCVGMPLVYGDVFGLNAGSTLQ